MNNVKNNCLFNGIHFINKHNILSKYFSLQLKNKFFSKTILQPIFHYHKNYAWKQIIFAWPIFTESLNKTREKVVITYSGCLNNVSDKLYISEDKINSNLPLKCNRKWIFKNSLKNIYLFYDFQNDQKLIKSNKFP